MSSKFYPLAIGPGVMSMPTKQVRSTAWSEVNLMRWREGAIHAGRRPAAIHLQLRLTLQGHPRLVRHQPDLSIIAYLCETNLYVDIGGTLIEITPSGGLVGPGLCRWRLWRRAFTASDIYGGVASVDATSSARQGARRLSASIISAASCWR